jgi:hypothetical protein
MFLSRRGSKQIKFAMAGNLCPCSHPLGDRLTKLPHRRVRAYPQNYLLTLEGHPRLKSACILTGVNHNLLNTAGFYLLKCRQWPQPPSSSSGLIFAIGRADAQRQRGAMCYHAMPVIPHACGNNRRSARHSVAPCLQEAKRGGKLCRPHLNMLQHLLGKVNNAAIQRSSI